MRSDRTGDMVTQLIRMVSDLQVTVREQQETIKGQQDCLEELSRIVMRNQTLAWQTSAMHRDGGLTQ